MQIEKNVPIPPSKQGRKEIYPLSKMQVGDSFFLATKIPKKTRHAVSNAAGKRSRRHPPEKFVTRLVVGGVRVWRVA